MYLVSTNTWGEVYLFYDAAFALEPEKVIWGNVDVLDDTGEVFLPGSDPVKLFPRRWWTNLLLAGLCSRPLPMGAREPVAYLYNGVRLPPLPEEWNPETHPCVTLYDATTVFDSFMHYRVYLSAGYTLRELDGYFGIGLSRGNNDIVSYDCYARNVDGDIMTGWNYERNDYIEGYALSNTLADNVLWSNTDIVLPDGTVYLAASEPVPIYE